MLIDIIALLFLLLAIYKGMSEGLIVALFSFAAFYIGLAAALKLSAAVAKYLGNTVSLSARWLPFIAFLLVFVLVILAVKLGAKLLQGIVQTMMLGWANRLGGVSLYVLLYFFIYSVLLFYATKLSIIKPATVQASVTYNWIEPYAPKLMNVFGSIVPFFKNMFADLLHFFDAASK